MGSLLDIILETLAGLVFYVVALAILAIIGYGIYLLFMVPWSMEILVVTIVSIMFLTACRQTGKAILVWMYSEEQDG